jgi:hypothetical protein
MHTVKFLAAIALCLTATVVQAAGFRFIEVPADADGPALTGAMWYPCSKPPGAIDLGGIIVSGAQLTEFTATRSCFTLRSMRRIA